MSVANIIAPCENPIPIEVKSIQIATNPTAGYYLRCDAQGNGIWEAGSGGSGVTTVTAGDASISIGGSTSNPTVTATGIFPNGLNVSSTTSLDGGLITTTGTGELFTEGVASNTITSYVYEFNGTNGNFQAGTVRSISQGQILGMFASPIEILFPEEPGTIKVSSAFMTVSNPSGNSPYTGGGDLRLIYTTSGNTAFGDMDGGILIGAGSAMSVAPTTLVTASGTDIGDSISLTCTSGTFSGGDPGTVINLYIEWTAIPSFFQ
jgi:hypothetical protein